MNFSGGVDTINGRRPLSHCVTVHAAVLAVCANGEKEPAMFTVARFYQFVHVPQPEQVKAHLLALFDRHGIRGTAILATEGINGTIAGLNDEVATVEAEIHQMAPFERLVFRHHPAETLPFKRLKVKVKPEIVTLGFPEINPGEKTGIHLSPADWNDMLLHRPEIPVIDTRNTYETRVGTFKGATDPKTATFRDFIDYVHTTPGLDKTRPVAMFCTGGVRCEKASAWMMAEGFETVYQLDGGILTYLQQTGKENQLWEGECFVFDDRNAVDS